MATGKMTNDNNLDIFEEFTMEEPLNHVVLKNYIDRFPGLAMELTDLYHELVLSDARSEIEDAQQEITSLDSAAASVESAFADDKLRSLAQRAGLPRDFFAGFRDRKVRLGSIPESFITGLARKLGVRVHALVDFLLGQPRTQAGFAFKADGKPKEGLKDAKN